MDILHIIYRLDVGGMENGLVNFTQITVARLLWETPDDDLAGHPNRVFHGIAEGRRTG